MPFFPRRIIGLHIADDAIEAAVLAHRRGRPTLVAYGHAPLPSGLVEGGIVLRPAEASIILRKLLADQMHPSLPRGAKRVALALPETQVFSHVFEVPTASEESALGRSMAAEAALHFSYPAHDLMTGQRVISVSHASMHVYFAALPKSAADSQLELCVAAGLEPVAIEGEAAAIARALFRKDEPGPSLLVNVGEKTVALAVFDLHGIHFSQTFEKPARPDRLVAEVRRAIKSFETEAERTIQRLFLAGEASMTPGLHDRFVEAMADDEIDVHMADPFDNVSISSGLEPLGLRTRGVLLATAIGLGLRGTSARAFPSINFLSRPSAAHRHFKKLPWSQRVGLAACGVLVIALGAWFVVFRAVPSVLDPATPQAVSAVPSGRTVTLSFALGPNATGPGALTAAPLDGATDVEQSFQHASSVSDGRASGSVHIINDQPTPQALVATTRFLSSGGVLFRLAKAVTIPAHGAADATIVADQPGASGDVAPGRFSIPGLAAAKQAKVYGTSAAAFTGGQVTTGAPFTDADLKADEDILSKQAVAPLAGGLRIAAGDRVLLDDLIAQTGLTIVSGPRVGQPTGPYTIQAHVTARGLAFSAGAVVQALARQAQKLDVAGSAPIVGPVTYKVTNVDIAAGTATLEASAPIQ